MAGVGRLRPPPVDGTLHDRISLGARRLAPRHPPAPDGTAGTQGCLRGVWSPRWHVGLQSVAPTGLRGRGRKYEEEEARNPKIERRKTDERWAARWLGSSLRASRFVGLAYQNVGGSIRANCGANQCGVARPFLAGCRRHKMLRYGHPILKHARQIPFSSSSTSANGGS